MSEKNYTIPRFQPPMCRLSIVFSGVNDLQIIPLCFHLIFNTVSLFKDRLLSKMQNQTSTGDTNWSIIGWLCFVTQSPGGYWGPTEPVTKARLSIQFPPNLNIWSVINHKIIIIIKNGISFTLALTCRDSVYDCKMLALGTP